MNKIIRINGICRMLVCMPKIRKYRCTSSANILKSLSAYSWSKFNTQKQWISIEWLNGFQLISRNINIEYRNLENKCVNCMGLQFDISFLNVEFSVSFDEILNNCAKYRQYIHRWTLIAFWCLIACVCVCVRTHVFAFFAQYTHSILHIYQ